MNNDKELKAIQKNIMLMQLMTAPANIAMGLGLYGVFAVTDNNAFLPILNNMEFCYGLIAVGAMVEIFAVIKLLPLWKKQASLKNAHKK